MARWMDVHGGEARRSCVLVSGGLVQSENLVSPRPPTELQWCGWDLGSVFTSLAVPGVCEGPWGCGELGLGGRPSLCQVPVAKHLIPQALARKAEPGP